MATQFQPRLVNKQFNSPIKLYSDANIRDTLDKQTHLLANGAVGIDFHNSNLSKPGNLANSAVLRMLEEEERQRHGQSPRAKRVTWPPPQPEDSNQAVQQVPDQSEEQQPPQGQYQAHPAPGAGNQQQQYRAGLPNQHQQPLSPIYINSNQQQQQQQPAQFKQLSPQAFSPNQQQQQQQSPRWAPVQSPVSPKIQAPQFQPNFQDQQYSAPAPAPAYRPVAAPVAHQPPPTLITLRPSPPISQAPAPVYNSQPATASLRGGNNMRGDQKWPPENVKQQTAAENAARIELAKGPAVRPRRIKKDYSGFFAQHALNSSYPGYKAPPGTQYYASNAPGVTNF